MRARWLKSRARQRVGVPFRITVAKALCEAHKFHKIPLTSSAREQACLGAKQQICFLVC